MTKKSNLVNQHTQQVCLSECDIQDNLNKLDNDNPTKPSTGIWDDFFKVAAPVSDDFLPTRASQAQPNRL